MRARLDQWAASRGVRLACCAPAPVDHALAQLASLGREGRLDPTFDHALDWFRAPAAGGRPTDAGVILVAMPRPAHLVNFAYRGESLDLVLPPTYHNYSGLFEEVRKDLEDFLGGEVPLRLVRVPFKTLATRMGFARYGRNNLTYVEGLGSYLQWMAFASPVAAGGALLAELPRPLALDRCATCRACRAACPTGAIDEERFLIHAERCVTWFSEKEGPLPDAFATARRPCLIGCMVCQEACPANAGRLSFARLAARFTHEETAYLIGEGTSPPPGLAAKLEQLRCSDCSLSEGVASPILRRNLKAALRRLGVA